MKVCDTIQMLESEKSRKLMTALYGEAAVDANIERYQNLVKSFQKKFAEEDVTLFSSPGRTEISGNHTDHNHGKVLAGSINLDCVGVAAKNNSSKVHIISETFNQSFIIDLNDLSPSDKKAGTIDLVKGLLQGFKESGYEVGGFNAYITSNVISAAGVSSSASFEMLLCSILNTFFNEGRMDTVAYATLENILKTYTGTRPPDCWIRWHARSAVSSPSIFWSRLLRLWRRSILISAPRITA